MKDFIVNKKFAVGFLIGILPVFLLNLLPNKIYYYGGCCVYYGFPFSFSKLGYAESEELIQINELFWFGLIGDFLFALLIAALAGLSLRFLANSDVDLK